MRLKELTAAGGAVLRGADCDVTALTDDSRKVVPGALFAAIPGQSANGGDYVPEALTRGAVAVLTSKILPTSIPQLISCNPRRALALAAARFYGEPAKKLRLIGITGTNGKTTIAYILRHVLATEYSPCGMLGTVEYDCGGEVMPAPLTTPGPLELQAALAKMVANDAVFAVLEASSHALTQERLAGIEFAGAVFTNLTRDHLDYHGTMENYAAAKERLFAALAPDAFAVVNSADEYASQMAAACQGRVIKVGRALDNDVCFSEPDFAEDGLQFTLTAAGHLARVKSPLWGDFNATNLALGAGVCAGLGISPFTFAAKVASFSGAPGRMQNVARPGQPRVLIDYAHTPDALSRAINAARVAAAGHLLLVFGCGGDRDQGKRRQMAQAATAADKLYLTSDNPRGEDPQAIIADIIAGFGAAVAYESLPDRALAIRTAINAARAVDTVLIAGKGHENYQLIRGRKVRLDDRELARRALGRWKEQLYAG